MSQTKLLDKIEEYRKEIINLSRLHGLSSNIVIQTSQELDVLLNEYQKKSSIDT